MWVVETEGEIPHVVRQALADIETYGEPFLARYNSLDDLLRKMEQSARINFELAHLMVGYAVAGDFSNARSVLTRLEDWKAEQPPLIVEQTDRFISGFRAYYDVGS